MYMAVTSTEFGELIGSDAAPRYCQCSQSQSGELIDVRKRHSRQEVLRQRRFTEGKHVALSALCVQPNLTVWIANDRTHSLSIGGELQRVQSLEFHLRHCRCLRRMGLFSMTK